VTEQELAALLKTPDGAVILRFVDRRIQNAHKAWSAKNPDTTALAGRLEKIEKAHHAAIAAKDLEIHTFKACVAAGVDYSLVSDLRFRDVEEADRKISQLAALVKTAETKKANEILTSGFRPGGGNAAPAKPAARRLSTADAIELESAGALNALIGGDT
jgi:hypothetical protein